MKRTHWRQFVGLPHRLAADPRVDDAADCLMAVFAVLDELGMSHPPIDPSWFERAAAGQWRDLRREYLALTAPSKCSDGAVVLLAAGMGVVVGGGFLFASHQDGASWVPLELMRSLNWRRFR